MSDSPEAERWREETRETIAQHGYQVNLLQGGSTPRWAYTVGLTERDAPEIVLAGALLLEPLDVKRAIDAAVEILAEAPGTGVIDVDGIGSFTVGEVDPTWSEELLLQAFDLYDRPRAVQLLPRAGLLTIDVPDMSQSFNVERAPVWRWLVEPWPFDISDESVAVTDPDVLRGTLVAEAARWEDDQWELFSQDPAAYDSDDLEVVQISTLLGFDESLWPVAGLPVEQAMRREPPGEWELWQPQGS